MRVFLFNASSGPGPTWWDNFSRKYDTWDDVGKLEYLESYGVKVITENDNPPYGSRYLDFPDEKTYTMFLLRWS